MAVQLGALHDEVNRVVNRGTVYNADIIRHVGYAVKWLERNFSYRYMRDLFSGTIAGGTRSVVYDTGTVKSVKFFRLLLADDSEYRYLEKGDPQDFSSFLADEPERYFLEEDRTFWLNVLADKDYPFDILLYRYSTWPVTAIGNFSSTTDEHWLLDNAFDLLLAQTLISLAPVMRNTRLTTEYVPLRNEALRTTIAAEEHFEDEGASHAMGIYIG